MQLLANKLKIILSLHDRLSNPLCRVAQALDVATFLVTRWSINCHVLIGSLWLMVNDACLSPGALPGMVNFLR